MKVTGSRKMSEPFRGSDGLGILLLLLSLPRIALAKPGTAPRSGREVEGSNPHLPMGTAGEHTSVIYVQGEGILRCQCDIVACLHHDRAARSH